MKSAAVVVMLGLCAVNSFARAHTIQFDFDQDYSWYADGSADWRMIGTLSAYGVTGDASAESPSFLFSDIANAKVSYYANGSLSSGDNFSISLESYSPFQQIIFGSYSAPFAENHIVYDISESVVSNRYYHIRVRTYDTNGSASFSVDEVRISGVKVHGDATSDNYVDAADYSIWADNFLKSLEGPVYGDFNWDGIVDAGDYTIWADGYLQYTYPAVATAAPEPSSFALAFLGVLGLFWHVHRTARTGMILRTTVDAKPDVAVIDPRLLA